MIDTYGWVAQLRTSRGVMRYPLPPVILERDGETLLAYPGPGSKEVTFHIPDTRTATAFEIRIPYEGGRNVPLKAFGLPTELRRGETMTIELPNPLVHLEGVA